MFANLPALPSDPLWGLSAAIRQDPRPHKIDLLVGVYRDETGTTPTLEVVKTAERELLAEGATKAYRGLAGNARFNAEMAGLLFGGASGQDDRRHTMQTIGASGALRLLADLVARAHPDATVWSSDPAYVNHRPLMEAAGLRVSNYRWRLRQGALDLDLLLSDLGQARRGDVVLLHGCCHNPSGIDLPAEGWAAMAALCNKRGIIPFVDVAYQGFGDGLDQDVAGLRTLASRVETLLVSASCSKNMGLYCERTGSATVMGASPAALRQVPATMERITRSNYSQPSEHGAAIAVKVFERAPAWREELERIRLRIVGLRRALGDALERRGAPAGMLAVRQHKGMFSMLPLSPEAMIRLREEFAIYGTEAGRINIAGLRTDQVETVADALAAVAGEAPRNMAA